ncbi:plasmid mobilization protein [Sulfitobacter sp. 1A12057]|uniref:plasmid mobilization protein n=1 Tax=Sulfitobacter sp. 1A12057 TaxID=3368567 RepID=UPI0037465153
MSPFNKANRTAQLKVNVSSTEKEVLMQKAAAAGRSLSDYLRHVGLGARAGASPVQVLQMVGLLEEALALLEEIAQQQVPAEGDGLVILARLQRIEQLLVLLAPVPFDTRTSAC